VGKATAEVNGVSAPIDSTNPKIAPLIKNGRTFIPLRFVLDTIGAETIWMPDNKDITIRYPKPALIAFENNRYSIKYPENWEKTTEDSSTMFASPEGNNINIVYGDADTQTVTFDQETASMIAMLRDTYPDIKIIESTKITLAGLPAHKLVYTATMEKMPLQMLQVWTTKNNISYAIMYGGTVGLYPNYTAVTQQMMDTFQIK
jgi:hypothetical protein